MNIGKKKNWGISHILTPEGMMNANIDSQKNLQTRSYGILIQNLVTKNDVEEFVGSR